MHDSDIEVQPRDLETIEGVATEKWLHLYHQMLRIRRFEEQIAELHSERRLFGPVHLYAGQEAVAVGICDALRQDDYITSTHRGHGHCLGKGAAMDRMFGELLGKATGYCHGKGGSMHIADPDTGNLGANGIVGGSSGIATGAALSARTRGTDQVAVCFFGEGALGQGLLYEAMNMAALWKLPVIYVCENNLYSEFGHYRDITAGSVRGRPEAFGIHNEEVDGQDVGMVSAVAGRLVERARAGEGPAFLACLTYRFHGHYTGDLNRLYRSREEEDYWKENRDPLKILGQRLREQSDQNEAKLEELERTVRDEVAAGLASAVEAPYPEPGELDQQVYA